MRALFDAVVVGAGTVRHDDPAAHRPAGAGPQSDPGRARYRGGGSLAHYRMFTDGAAPTLVLCADELVSRTERLGQAEVVGVATSRTAACDPRRCSTSWPARGLRRVFVEGGGITVSRFLAAGCLHRLQITIAPLIIGSGRPSITLPEIGAAQRRPATRRCAKFDLGQDVLFECRLDG